MNDRKDPGVVAQVGTSRTTGRGQPKRSAAKFPNNPAPEPVGFETNEPELNTAAKPKDLAAAEGR